MDAVNFVSWYFDKHYVLSTLATPYLSLAWGFYVGSTTRVAFCMLPTFLYLSSLLIQIGAAIK